MKMSEVIDSYIQVIKDGNVLVCGDTEISDVSRRFGKPVTQVYKRNFRTLNKTGKVIYKEYIKLHYNSIEAISDFLEKRDRN